MPGHMFLNDLLPVRHNELMDSEGLQFLLLPGVQALLQGGRSGVLWSAKTEQLNINVLSWNAGEGVERHVNHEVDVAIIVLQGTGVLTVQDQVRTLDAGSIVVVPRGIERAISTQSRLAYVTVHPARRRLMPAPLRGRGSAH